MASVYLRGKIWWIRYRASDGSLAQKSLKTADKKIAVYAKKKIEYEMATGQPVIGTIPTFGEYVEGYLAWREQEFPDSHDRVAQIVAQHLMPEFELMTLDSLRKAEIENWVTKRRKAIDAKGNKAKTATIEKELRTLRAILNHAVDNEVIPVNRMAKYRLSKSTDDKVPEGYSQDQLDALYQASPNHASLWRLMVNTGIRRSEARNLRLKDTSSDQIVIVSEPGARTKSKKSRVVPLNQAARSAVEALKKQTKGEYLCPRIHRASYTRAFAKCANRAALPGSIHWLRHTYALHLLLAGVPTRVVQELLGHSALRLTERYARVLPGDALISAVQAIEL